MAQEWPADRPERRALSSLRPFPRNARTHSPEQIAQVAASITEWGWTFPVLIDESGEIIAGHARVLAAQRLGLTEVPCLVAAIWSDEQKRAYIIADNKLGLNAGWDEGLLSLEITDLKALGFDVGLTGFHEGEVDELFAKAARRAGLTDADDAPPLPPIPISRLGDVWLLGENRLVCGDCTGRAIVERALGGRRPHLMVTDPPYGVEYDPSWRKAAGLVGASKFASGKVDNDHRADWREAWALFPGSVAYVWHGGLHAATVARSLQAMRFGIRAQIVWVKTRPVVSRGHYHWQHEPALYGVRDGEEEHWHFMPAHEVANYAVKDGATGAWHGGRKQSTVWFIEHLKNDTGHSTQKPVECMRRPIENNSKAGDAVYDPFVGSGTTIIAAEMSARCCYAIELNPAYVDVAIRRWQAFTGETAHREADGKTLSAIEQESGADEAGKETDAAGVASAARQPAPARDADRRARRPRGAVAAP